VLGRGGMGEVYRADDLTLDQPVALKFFPEGAARDQAHLAQFHNELRTARQVSHKNVCRLYDLGEADGRRFLTMEYVDGEDLASLLRRIGRIPQDKAVELARQLCAGVAAAHERGVLHRDLKPANVMIDGDGNVRITDFGIATAGADTTHAFAVTPQYMAPEQLAGQPASVKTDLSRSGSCCSKSSPGRALTTPSPSAT
jgi:serine/threonine protein kinase